MTTLLTNRDFYLAVLALCESRRDDERALDVYLLALLGLAERHAQQDDVTLDQMHALLGEAFEAAPRAFDPQWLDASERTTYTNAYERWRACAIAQVVDLREMEACGALANEYRYFGIDAPRGSRWYNFDPCTYLECAAAGAFGGWEPEDDGGRCFVPGKVATIGPDATIVAANPEDIERPIVSLPLVDWAAFVEFLWMGQCYE